MRKDETEGDREVGKSKALLHLRDGEHLRLPIEIHSLWPFVSPDTKLTTSATLKSNWRNEASAGGGRAVE